MIFEILVTDTTKFLAIDKIITHHSVGNLHKTFEIGKSRYFDKILDMSTLGEVEEITEMDKIAYIEKINEVT